MEIKAIQERRVEPVARTSAYRGIEREDECIPIVVFVDGSNGHGPDGKIVVPNGKDKNGLYTQNANYVCPVEPGQKVDVRG